jgi:hypothetical protein
MKGTTRGPGFTVVESIPGSPFTAARDGKMTGVGTTAAADGTDDTEDA